MNPRVRNQLCQILAKYGRSLHLEPRRCENLLRDLCPTNKREVHVLVAALRENVPADLVLPALQNSVAASVGRLSKRLEDNLGLAEGPARWAVETWALALGVVTPRQLIAAQPLRQALPTAPVVTRRVMVARQRSSKLGWMLVAASCLLLAGSGVGLAVYWQPTPRAQATDQPAHGHSTLPAGQVVAGKAVTLAPSEPAMLPAKASTRRNAAVHDQPGEASLPPVTDFPPITAEEIETARGALLPQPPFLIPEASL